KLARARADFDQPYYRVAGAIDANDQTGWGVHPEVSKPHHAEFHIAEPVAAVGTVLRVTLEFKSGHRRHQLGRFRLSVSSAPPPIERASKYLTAIRLTDPWAKLAAAYYVLGDQQALAALVRHHPKAASGLGDLYAIDQDWERAIAAYGQLLANRPDDVAL